MGVPFNPPGPKGLPLVGNLLEFRKDKLAFFTRLAETYGGLARFRIGPRPVVLLSDPAMIEQVLVMQQRNFVKHFVLSLLRPVLGEGLVTSEGDFWLRQRRMIQPSFQRSQVEKYGDTIVAYTERMLDGWQSGDRFDIHAEMMHLTLGIVAKALLGAEVSGEFDEVSDALDILMRDFTYRFEGLIRLPPRLPTPWNRRVRRHIARLDQVIYRIIAERRAGRLEGDDLLTRLMKAQDVAAQGLQPTASSLQPSMTDKQLRDEVMTLFLAGHETTANALSWTWYLLAQNPQVEGRLLSELQTVLGGRSPTVADVARLSYTENVLRESMRLFPPVYAIGRRSVGPCEMCGIDVPAETTFLMSQWVLHRSAKYFDAPLEFRPERWENDLARQIPKFVYFPFGGGPRTCVGNSFAMLEAALVLATIAQRYRFELAPRQRVETWPTVTLRLRHGLKVVCHAHASAVRVA